MATVTGFVGADVTSRDLGRIKLLFETEAGQRAEVEFTEGVLEHLLQVLPPVIAEAAKRHELFTGPHVILTQPVDGIRISRSTDQNEVVFSLSLPPHGLEHRYQATADMADTIAKALKEAAADSRRRPPMTRQ